MQMSCNYISIQQDVNTHTLCYSVVETARATCSSLVPKAQLVAGKFETALSLFAKCHSLYDSSQCLTDAEIDSLGEHFRE